MTKIKLCGMMRAIDIETTNILRPDYIGFVFAEKSKRYVSPDTARALRDCLHPDIQAVGVFVQHPPEYIADLLNGGVIDISQLHGGESDEYIHRLRALTDKPILHAVRVTNEHDLERASHSLADMILLDNGAGGTGEAFNWNLLRDFDRPYFLAGGLDAQNVEAAVRAYHPFAVDVSSGIESNGAKDAEKMRTFVEAVRRATE